MKKQKIKIIHGSNQNWFIYLDGLLIAGFKEKDDVEWFAENRFPDAEIEVK